jgi:chromosomal replication initiator protein
METVWNRVKSTLKQRIPSHSFSMWIEPLKVTQTDEGNWDIACPNFFSKKRVESLYGAMIKTTLQRALGLNCHVSFIISNKNGHSGNKAQRHLQLPLPDGKLPLQNGLLFRKDFTFDSFVVGGNNDFAYSASLAMASRKGAQHNGLFLLSKTGLGKSHLSQAIGNYILSTNANDRIYYITADDFSTEMVQAYRHDAIDRFKAKYRSKCDVLLLEDVHHLSGKERTQIELALILDSLFESGKRIIFSSCYLPADIPKLSDKLRSRLSCGLISAIDPPGFKTRVRILQRKARLNSYQFPDNILDYLAGELTEDVRQLESGLNGVAAKASLLGMPINLSLAESVVKNIVRQRKRITIEAIKKLVCTYYDVSIEDVMSRSRKQNLVRPRQMAIYLARNYTDSPLQSIGKSFNRYHATALHSINCIERGIKQNSSIKTQVSFLREKLESGKF